ncbi:MAG: N-acetyltransferase [Synechococcus lacustris]|jgi:hypothetical protein
MMPYFRSQPPPPRLPQGYGLSCEDLPVNAEAVNALLQRCGAPARPDGRIALALERSAWTMRLERENQLVGFLRITSDQALNANLWDLAVLPEEPQREKLLAVLVHAALCRLRKELPGCSISLAAVPEALPVLETYGFITDPNGIRAMGLNL